MYAVHFGAGNIGRGFIGLLLYQSGYRTTFVDVDQSLVDTINDKQQYQVKLASENSDYLQVKDVDAVNSKTTPEAVKQAILEADIVTTAIGPHVLPYIAELIAQSLQERLMVHRKPLNIIACENMVGAGSFLKDKVFSYIEWDKKELFQELFGFPNAAVDRIVPNQEESQPLEVAVEPYFEWIVEAPQFKGEKPVIGGMTYVEELQPYIERKLFTVNTGHAVPAYMGYYLGFETIREAMCSPVVQETIQGVLNETGEALIQTYNFDRQQHQIYKKTIIERFKNPYISDAVTRVGRNPIRKLGPNDRLIYPAKLYEKKVKEIPQYLAKLIALTLLYDAKEDEESAQLQNIIIEYGYKQTLMKVASLDAEDLLIKDILEKVKELI